jgi:hypothetical protein
MNLFKRLPKAIRTLLGIAVLSLGAAYVLNNAKNIPNVVWWVFPAWVWAHVNYYVVLPSACFILVSVSYVALRVVGKRVRS